MLPVTILWERVKAKTGDDITIVISPSERAMLFGLVVNATNPSLISGANDDSDAYDDFISKLLSKVS